MTKNKQDEKHRKTDTTEKVNKKTDHLFVYEAVSPSLTNNMLKLETTFHENVKSKTLTLKIKTCKYKHEIAQIKREMFNENGCQTQASARLKIDKNKKITNGNQALQSAFLEVDEIMKNMKYKELALSLKDELFKNFKVATVKDLASTAIESFQLLLYNPPEHVQNPNVINNILHD